MKIAYISLHWPRKASSSIGKKIIRQTAEWESMGHEVHFFSHLHAVNNEKELIEGTNFFYNQEMHLFKREFSRIAAARNLIKAVSAYQPDLIYLRWGMFVLPMQKVFAIAPTVVEINTNDRKEHKLLGFGLASYNRLTRWIFLSRTSGLLFTSNEFVKDRAFSRYTQAFHVIANGIDLESIPFYEAPANNPPHLIFLGTPGMAWHGLDKLIDFGKAFSDIQIDIIGSSLEDSGKQVSNNINFHGYLTGKEFESKLANADAAIGSISLHLNEMDEASPFKIRDCAGRGIPCILPYQDTDLSGLDCGEILQIPNTADNLQENGQLVHDFVYAMRGRRLSRSITKNRIDIGLKEQKRAVFFEQVLKINN